VPYGHPGTPHSSSKCNCDKKDEDNHDLPWQFREWGWGFDVQLPQYRNTITEVGTVFMETQMG